MTATWSSRRSSGAAAALPGGRVAPPLGPRLHVCQRGLPGDPRRTRHHLQHEPSRRLLRQCGDGKLLLDGQERARRSLRPASAKPRWRCSTTSRCSITSGVVIQRSARSARQLLNDVPPLPDDHWGRLVAAPPHRLTMTGPPPSARQFSASAVTRGTDPSYLTCPPNRIRPTSPSQEET